MLLEQDELQNLRVRIFNYCGKVERAPLQVLRKLTALGANPAQAKLLLHELKTEKLVDEERFCKAYARTQFKYYGWGVRKIRYNLQMLKLPPAEIKIGLAEIDVAEYDSKIIFLIRQKVKSVNKKGLALKAALADYLVQKGYEEPHVWAALAAEGY